MRPTVHQWTQDGKQWVCAAYDHGPMCRFCRCIDDDEILQAMMGNVDAGFMEISGTNAEGELLFKLRTPGTRGASPDRRHDRNRHGFDVVGVDMREAAMNVVTVYDDHIALENRGPWRDLLASWATCDDWNGERRGPGGSPWHGSGYCIHDRSAE